MDITRNKALRKIVDDFKMMPAHSQAALISMLESHQKREKRKNTRKNCMLNIDYSNGKQIFNSFSRDISPGGMFIETFESHMPGSEVIMAFSFPKAEEPFKLGGKVIYSTAKGIGLKFNKITQYQAERIKDLSS